jgi:hypothetical protein
VPASSIPKRVEDFVFYYYAKLVIAPSAGFAGNYRFVIDSYKRLKSGDIHMSEYERELLRLTQQPAVCNYCEKPGIEILPSEVVPRTLGGPIGIHNLVMACRPCYSSKKGRDLVEWWRKLGNHHDTLPRVPVGLYLKIAYELHRINFSLGAKCTDLAQVFQLLRKGKTGIRESSRTSE